MKSVAVFGLLFALTLPANAEKVGVAAAVNPDAFSSLAGKPQTQLNIGKSIFYNERINTTGSGLVQVLLIDGSTFTVGPGSDLVIDSFVYDPKKGTGQITASFSKGVMRFVGGKLSKNDGGVTVNTPAGALAIRGAIAYADFKSTTNYSVLFAFGEYLKLGGKTLYEPGFGWFMNNGNFQTKKFSATDLKTILASLTNTNSNWGGKPPDPPKSSDTSWFKTQSLQQLISDANTQMVIDDSKKNPPPIDNGGGGCSPDCPDTRANGIFNGYASGFLLTSGAPKSIGNLSPDEVILILNTTENTVVAGLTLREIDPTSLLKLLGGFLHSTEYEFGFGAVEGQPNYLPDGSYDVTAHPEGSITEHFFIFSRTTPASVSGTLASGSDGLCDGCDFMQWGRWESSLTPTEGHNPQTKTLQGFWVAGDVAKESDLLPLTGEATYSGSAFGYASSKIDGQWTPLEMKKGDMDMSWNFATRSGRLDISNFDGKNFGGTMCGAGLLCPKGDNHFVGALSGPNNIKGAAAGSFVNNGPNNPAAGVIGNFGVGNNEWKANGVFGGQQTSLSTSPVTGPGQ